MTLKLNDPAFLASSSGAGPAGFSNLLAWWKSDSFSLSDGTAIGGVGNEWLDQSGNVNHLTQAVAGARPLFKTNIFGSMPSIRFDGTDDELSMTSTLVIPVFTIIGIAAVSADSGLLGKSDNTFQIRIFRSGANVISYYDGVGDLVSDTFAIVSTDARMMTWRREADNDVLFRENKTDQSAGATSTLTIGLNRVGRLSYGQFLTGDIGEIVIYGAERTNAELDALYEGYFKPRWGLP